MSEILDQGWQQNVASSIAHAATMAQATVQEVAQRYATPSAIYRPALSIDGAQWCALYGDNLQDGVAGFGNSPAEAMAAFDAAWHAAIAQAMPAAQGERG